MNLGYIEELQDIAFFFFGKELHSEPCKSICCRVYGTLFCLLMFATRILRAKLVVNVSSTPLEFDKGNDSQPPKMDRYDGQRLNVWNPSQPGNGCVGRSELLQ